eukprot:840045-Prorocentrum_minimum.AAC.3
MLMQIAEYATTAITASRTRQRPQQPKTLKIRPSTGVRRSQERGRVAEQGVALGNGVGRVDLGEHRDGDARRRLCGPQHLRGLACLSARLNT